MSISPSLNDYLEQRGARFEVCAHHHSRTSAETARAAHILSAQLAKSVILEDERGLVMAVVPGDREVRVGELGRLLGRHGLHLSDERGFAGRFADCERGAVPPLGMIWGVETVVDDALDAADTVYLEAGDHERLLRMSREQFQRLIGGVRRGHFCRPLRH